MSWFDDLFSNKENSDEELLRRKSKRRKDSRRRRRRNHINQDDTGIPSIKSRSPKSSNKYIDTCTTL